VRILPSNRRLVRRHPGQDPDAVRRAEHRHRPNGAGKSTWHAAMIRGALRPGRRPRPSRADRRFAEDHEPWDGGDWEVSAEIEFATGSGPGQPGSVRPAARPVVTALDHESRPLPNRCRSRARST